MNTKQKKFAAQTPSLVKHVACFFVEKGITKKIIMGFLDNFFCIITFINNTGEAVQWANLKISVWLDKEEFYTREANCSKCRDESLKPLE